MRHYWPAVACNCNMWGAPHATAGPLLYICRSLQIYSMFVCLLNSYMLALVDFNHVFFVYELIQTITFYLQTIRCMFGCREHININTPLPKGFKSKLIGSNTMKVYGRGKPQEFETILQNIEYQNELFTPTLGVRKIKILPVQENTALQPITITIRIERNDKPVITVKGCADNAVELKHLKEIGVPVCSTFTIDYQGCKPSDSPVNGVKLLDQAVVKVTPPFTKSESFNFPKQANGGSTLDDLDLKAFMNEDGIIIRGIANYKTYEEVLREMFYVNPNASEHLHHTFTVSTISILNLQKSAVHYKFICSRNAKCLTTRKTYFNNVLFFLFCFVDLCVRSEWQI